MVSRDFWRGRRVFLTGHTGFKGAWLSLWLQRLGALVTGFALEPTTQPSLFELGRVAEGMDSVIGDVTDAARLETAMTEARPEVVFHLAAQAIVRHGYAHPVETFGTNVMGTVHLLDAIRRCPSVRAIVVVTSDKCYENREDARPFRESEPMGGRDPYSASKGCAELVTDAYRRSYFSGDGPRGVASARAGNVIGGGDWAADRLVPDLLRAFSEGRPALVRHPGAVRPWQHVLEPLRGYMLLAERLWVDPSGFSSAWNFGPGSDDARPVQWLADTIAARWGGNAAWQRGETPLLHEAGALLLDSARARELLGWHPRVKLETALQWVVDWHRAVFSGGDARVVTLDQIERFESMTESQS